jgi:glucosamine--fructose-6-phosphate aminotransferase (isomerizing)
MLGSVYLSTIAGITSIPVLAPQFIAQYAPSINAQDVGIFVSQSGETKDILNALSIAQDEGMGTIGLVNVIGSTLMRSTENYLPLACGYEISVPATKTFTNQVISFLYLSLHLAGLPTDGMLQLPHLMGNTIDLIETLLDEILPHLEAWNDLYCLGYGHTYPIALEGALKLKEITYAHCEGMLSTEFKHGPLSAVIDGYPVIFVAHPRDTRLIVSGINEVTCRGGKAIVIGEENPSLRANSSAFIPLPDSGAIFNPILSIIPLQLISYRMSLQRGYDPDFPRNLSKTLTVD